MSPPGGCMFEVFFSWGQRERGGGGEDPGREITIRGLFSIAPDFQLQLWPLGLSPGQR